MALLKKLPRLLLVFLLTLLIPQLSYYSTLVLIPTVNQDPWKSFAFMVIHHGIQLILSVVLLKAWFRTDLAEVGFNLGEKVLSFRILKWFLFAWLITVVLFYLVSLIFFQGFGNYVSGYFPADTRFLLKDFAFEVLMPGLGEEPLFRAFVILALIQYWNGAFKVGKLHIPHVALISGFFFMIAHVNYNIYPFYITNYDVIQLIITFVLGVFWAAVFVRTRSLLCPILAHNGANVIQYAVGYFTSFILIR